MIGVFDGLTEREIEILLTAPVWVCILVGGADGTIDRKEIRQAMVLAGKKERSHPDLSAFLSVATADFEDKVAVLLQAYPHDPELRSARLVEELQSLNAILPKLTAGFRKVYYELLKELARAVATSSGGVFGYRSVTDEEARFMELAMIARP